MFIGYYKVEGSTTTIRLEFIEYTRVHTLTYYYNATIIHLITNYYQYHHHNNNNNDYITLDRPSVSKFNTLYHSPHQRLFTTENQEREGGGGGGYCSNSSRYVILLSISRKH